LTSNRDVAVVFSSGTVLARIRTAMKIDARGSKPDQLN
jgi:hypothetical protein